MRRYLRAALAGALLVGGVSLVAMIAGTAPASAQPAVSLYVASGGSGDCTSQLNACGSIQTAINTAEGGSYSGDDVTINVAAGTYTENDTMSSSSTNSLTIAGAGASATTVNGGGIGSVFAIGSGTVTVEGLTITNGMSVTGYGDGIYVNVGTVNVTDCTVSDNGNPGGGWGAGIYNFGATVTMTGSTFTNDNRYFGGAINNAGGTMTVTDSTLSGNSSANGGGIYNGATMHVTGSTFSDNSGLAIYNDYSGNLTLSDSTLLDNSGYFGGAIENNFGAVLTVTDSTLSGNSAGCCGGGIGNFNGATVNLGATIVANSTSGGDCSLGGGTFNDLGYNLDDDGSCGFTATGDVSDASADLDPSGLQSNGGPTQTIALEAGSPAIRAVTDPSLCPPTDQRGYVRNTPCDMGAFETDTVVAPCTPGSTGCSATVSAPSQTVAVTGVKAASASASITLVVAPAVLGCTNFNYEAPVATLTDSHLSGTDVLVTDTVHNLPSKKGVVICYQSLGDNGLPFFLAKCHGAFAGACFKSLSESAGSVVAKLELPVGDPRFHIGGETPSVTSYSPTTARPGHPLTIKGANLSEVTSVTIGGVAARITKAAPTSVKVTVPTTAKSGVVVVSSAAGAVAGHSVTVSGTRIPVHSSKLTRDEHRRR